MKARGLRAQARIGLELDAFYFTGRSFAELTRALPDAQLIDVYPLVNWVRIVKSPSEIEMMRAAAAIVSNAMKVGMAAIEPRACASAMRWPRFARPRFEAPGPFGEITRPPCRRCRAGSRRLHRI